MQVISFGNNEYHVISNLKKSVKVLVYKTQLLSNISNILITIDNENLVLMIIIVSLWNLKHFLASSWHSHKKQKDGNIYISVSYGYP